MTGSAGTGKAGYPRYVGTSDHDHALYEGRHRHDEGKGIRDDYVVLVGGAPLNEEFGKAVGADAYCRDAAVAVETAKEFISRKHNSMGARA